MSAKIIAPLNFNGRVGKTANVVNLSACLSHLRKKRMMVIDLNPQCELEERFTEAQVRDMARAAGLKVTKAAKKKSLITNLIPYARRHYENTALNFQG